MNYWRIIFIITLVITVISALLTLFLIIKYRIFSLIRFNLNNSKNSASEKSKYKTKIIPDQPVKTEELRNFTKNIPETSENTGTVITNPKSSNLNYSKSKINFTVKEIVIHTDSSAIDDIISGNNI